MLCTYRRRTARIANPISLSVSVCLQLQKRSDELYKRASHCVYTISIVSSNENNECLPVYPTQAIIHQGNHLEHNHQVAKNQRT